MTFMKLGFRSLFRQKRRTLMTLIVVTFGVGCLLMTIGHSRFVAWGLRESTIHSETGHLQVYHEAFFDEQEETVLQHGVDGYESIREELNRMLDVNLVLARVDIMGLISDGDKSVACIGQGVEPRREKMLRTMSGMVGSQFDSLIVHARQMEIIALGTGLAKSLNARVGKWLTLMTTTAQGALNALDVQVVNIFQGGSPEYDARAILLPLKTAQMLLNTDKVKKILITLDETEKTEILHRPIRERLREKGYPVRLRRWEEETIYYHQVRQFFNRVTMFISVILYIIVFFSTSNTIVMSIVERTTEIGTLLSMGTSRSQTVRMFFFEGIFIGILGGLLSIVFAYGISHLINGLDIVMQQPGSNENYPILIRNEWGYYGFVFLCTVIVTTVSSILPALRVTRLKIVEALRHV